MINESFLLGVLFGVYGCVGFFFLRTKRENMPFREAFGWTMVMCAVVVLLDYFIVMNEVETISSITAVGMSVDLLAAPFYIMEFYSIVNQDVELVPWKDRWLRLLILEIPIVGLLVASMAGAGRWSLLAVVVLFLVYAVATFVYIYVNVRRYEKLLDKYSGFHRGSGVDRFFHLKNDSTKWVWYIVILMLVQNVSYAAFDNIPFVVYTVVSIIVMMLHAYFINKQAPVNTTVLYQMTEEQEQVLEDLKGVTQELRTQLDMDTMIKAFKVEHPTFEADLRALTDNKLTKRDVYLSMLISEGKRIGEIAECLSISPSSVEVARHRLRGKLNLEKGANLNAVLKRLAER